MNVLIRRGKPSDAAELNELGRKTFLEKWVNQTSPQNMKIYLDENFTVNKIASELSNPDIIYVVAEENKRLVGFARLLFTHPDVQETTPEVSFKSNKPIEISRIYVSPELIGQSIGAKMMYEIVSIARDNNCDLIWLGVWGENQAVNFYKKHGFQKAGTHKFMLGDQEDTDWVMVRRV